MADVTISLTIPEAYQPRLLAWIDANIPKPDGITYPNHLKNILRDYVKGQVRMFEYQKSVSDIPVPDEFEVT